MSGKVISKGDVLCEWQGNKCWLGLNNGRLYNLRVLSLPKAM